MRSIIGHYVNYKDKNYLVVANNQGLLQLNSTVHSRVQVHFKNVQVLQIPPAKTVEYRHQKYLVTTKKNIFSLTTGKLMQWSENDGNRKAILAL
jgi:hypothetical protein